MADRWRPRGTRLLMNPNRLIAIPQISRRLQSGNFRSTCQPLSLWRVCDEEPTPEESSGRMGAPFQSIWLGDGSLVEAVTCSCGAGYAKSHAGRSTVLRWAMTADITRQRGPIGNAGLALDCATLPKVAICVRASCFALSETCHARSYGFPMCSPQLKRRRKRESAR
jgi:hypothetical protein